MPYTWTELHDARLEEKKDRLDRLTNLIDNKLRHHFKFGDHAFTSDAVVKLEIPNREFATRWEMDEVERRFRAKGWEYVRIWRPWFSMYRIRVKLQWRLRRYDDYGDPYAV